MAAGSRGAGSCDWAHHDRPALRGLSVRLAWNPAAIGQTVYRGGPTRLVIGAGCEIRESVTMNIGTEADRGVTEVGERCFFMVGTHIGHDCHIGSDVTMANNVVLGGHVSVGDFAVLGGLAAIHQFVRIGEGAMVAGFSGIQGDLIPYGMGLGQRANLTGLNVVGMRRRGFKRDDIHRARRFYRDLFLGDGDFATRLAAVGPGSQDDPLLGRIIAFIRARKKRPLLMARAGAADESAEAPRHELGGAGFSRRPRRHNAAGDRLRRRKPAVRRGGCGARPGRRRVVLFPIRGFADQQRVTAYPHHWIWLGRYGAFRRLALREGCRDVVVIGGLQRPSLRQIRLDWKTVRVFPRIVAAFRGGDDHLLTGIARIMEDDGLHFVASHAAAPDILVPEGVLGSIAPGERACADMARGLAAIDAIGAFDVGQATVVANNHVLAVEAAEGTDGMLARIAELRKAGRVRTPAGVGVLVKVPKIEQDRRFDLPAIGVGTIEFAAAAGLAGIAVEAGGAITANLAAVRASAPLTPPDCSSSAARPGTPPRRRMAPF